MSICCRASEAYGEKHCVNIIIANTNSIAAILCDLYQRGNHGLSGS